MAWNEVDPFLSGAKIAEQDTVVFATGMAGRGKTPCAYLSFREGSRVHPLLAPGVGVKMLVGSGEHQGMLRLIAGGAATFKWIGGHSTEKKKPFMRLMVKAWEGLPAKQRGAVTVKLEVDAIVVHLPEWAWPREAQPAASAPTPQAQALASLILATNAPVPAPIAPPAATKTARGFSSIGDNAPIKQKGRAA